MCSKNGGLDLLAEQKQEFINDVALSSVELVPDSSDSGPPGVDHDIRTLRNGRVVRVQEWASMPRKLKKVDAILGLDKFTHSSGITKCTRIVRVQERTTTSSPAIGKLKNVESQQATLSPGIKKRKNVESQQAALSPGIKKHKSVEFEQAIPSPGIKKHQNTGSQLKTKSLAALSDQTAKSNSKASESGVQESNSFGEQEVDLILWKAADDDSSSKKMQQTSSDAGDDIDTTGGFLKDFLQRVKSKNKISPAKPLKVSNKLPSDGINCDEFYSDGKGKLSSSNSTGKRKNRSEKENTKTKAGEILVLEDEETLACYKDKAIKKYRSHRTSSHQLQHHAGFQLNHQEQAVSNATDPENSSQNAIFSESAGNSYAAQLNNRELQEMSDLTNPEKFTENVPTSESSGGLYPQSKLDLASSCGLGINCQNNAVEVMELDKPESKMQRSENLSDKLSSQKDPYLVESVFELAADSDKHTSKAMPMNKAGSGLNTGNLSIASEENYSVDQHRSFSPGAKVKLFSSTAKLTLDRVDGSFIGESKSNFIDRSDDEDLIKKDKSMPEISQLESTIATSLVDVIHVSSVHVGLHPIDALTEQDDCGDAFQELPAKLPSVRKSMTPYSQERLLQAADFRQAFMKSPSVGSAESDAAHKMNTDSDTNSNGFTFQSSDANGLESPCHNRMPLRDGFTFQSSDANGLESPCHKRMPLQVDDFRRAFTKSPPAGCASQQCESDAADKMDVDSDLCHSNSKGFTFQSPDVHRSPRHSKRLLQIEDYRRFFMKSPPTGSASQQSDSDAADNTNLVSCDSKSNALISVSPDIKCLGSPNVNKRPIRRRNSPMPQPKSPQSCILHHIPLVADHLGIQSSPLPQRNIADNNHVGNHREEAFPSSAVKSILKSPGVCPAACKCDICYNIQSRAEKASEFTQRQMRDIENLANNLVRELNSMRTIVEENLNSEAVRPTVEEMKSAAASALEVEETTKKWIAMMSRDCNRFCQIMQRPVDKKPSFSSDREKQQKKIIFADEAGKELCHFKIFENDEQEDY